jgi:hypothetical protein
MVLGCGVLAGLSQSVFAEWLETEEIEALSNNLGPWRLPDRAKPVLLGLGLLSSPLGGLVIVPFDWQMGLTYALGAGLTYGAISSPELARNLDHPLDTQRDSVLGTHLIAVLAVALIILLPLTEEATRDLAAHMHVYTGIFLGCAVGAVHRTISVLKYRRERLSDDESLWRIVSLLTSFAGPGALAFMVILAERLVAPSNVFLERVGQFLVMCTLGTFLTWGGLGIPWSRQENPGDER